MKPFSLYPLGAFTDDPAILEKMTKDELVKLVIWLKRRDIRLLIADRSAA